MMHGFTDCYGLGVLVHNGLSASSLGLREAASFQSLAIEHENCEL